MAHNGSQRFHIQWSQVQRLFMAWSPCQSLQPSWMLHLKLLRQSRRLLKPASNLAEPPLKSVRAAGISVVLTSSLSPVHQGPVVSSMGVSDFPPPLTARLLPRLRHLIKFCPRWQHLLMNSVCQDTTTEVFPEFPVCLDTTKVVHSLSACPDTTRYDHGGHP